PYTLPVCDYPLSFQRSGHPRVPLSFPTRRSSDLEQAGERAPVGAEPLQRVESAHPGHLDVEEGDVETVRVDLAQGLCSVGGLGYDLDGGIGVEDPDDAGPHEGVVVGDQDSDR